GADEALAVGGEADAVDPTWMRLNRSGQRVRWPFQARIGELADDLAVGDVPELDAAVAASGGDAFAVGAEGGTEDAVVVALVEFLVLVAFELADHVARRRVPELHRVIEAAGEHLLTVGRPNDGVNGRDRRLEMGGDHLRLVLGEIPDAEIAVVATGG